MHRFGIVSEVRPSTGEVRVVFPAHEDLPSDFIPVVLPFTLGNAAYWLPDLNTQVLCALDEDEEPIAVLGGVFSDEDAPPVTSADKVHVRFEDGSFIEYDRAAHRYEITVKAGNVVLNVDAGQHVHIGGEGGEELVTRSHLEGFAKTHTHLSGPPGSPTSVAVVPPPTLPGVDLTTKQRSE